VSAVRAAGKLHRDLEPSKVLVMPEGRVVVLDFGLVADTAPPEARAIAGTRGYMAPEQAAGLGASAASDWYRVGVMLHEALTGRLPAGGDPSLLPPAHGRLGTGQSITSVSQQIMCSLLTGLDFWCRAGRLWQ
jgi:serine/threonine protein kinase